MTGTTAQQYGRDETPGLPRPHRDSRWRWSRRGQAVVAGGALAAVLGLGVGTGAAAAAGASATSGNSGGATRDRAPAGMARPTVAGTVTALSGNTVTVETHAGRSFTVVTSSSTTYKTNSGPGGSTTSDASALKVGAVIGVQGTKHTGGTVTATTVVIGRPPQIRRGPAWRATGSGAGAGAGAGAGCSGGRRL